MLNISLLLFSNKNENTCDSSKSKASLLIRNAVYENVLEIPSNAQSSLYVAVILQHFASVHVYMFRYISITITRGLYVLSCHKNSSSDKALLTVIRYITESPSVTNAQRCEAKHMYWNLKYTNYNMTYTFFVPGHCSSPRISYFYRFLFAQIAFNKS